MADRSLIKHIMNTSVITITPDVPLDEALRLMKTKNISRLVVVNETGKLLGIISERDFRLFINSPFLHEPPVEVLEQFHAHKVREIFKTAVVTIEEDSPIVDAVKLMRVANVGGLPVLNDKGDLVGIVTRSDLLDQLIRLLEPYSTNQ